MRSGPSTKMARVPANSSDSPPKDAALGGQCLDFGCQVVHIQGQAVDGRSGAEYKREGQVRHPRNRKLLVAPHRVRGSMAGALPKIASPQALCT